jgi:1,4-dihydroxy-2-naphthoate octaprenyltransferase
LDCSWRRGPRGGWCSIGFTAICAGWFYTGGPPYGYYGFGELFVLIYFGFVATVGTTYVQHLTIPSRSWWLGVATGFMACALLEANNLRDVEGDRVLGQEDVGGAHELVVARAVAVRAVRASAC